MNGCHGFLLVNKPAGISSFDVIRKVRAVYSCKKIGHAGTLDPMAQGLLILAFGQATRLLPYLVTEPKVYRFEICFGVETDTLDDAGTITSSGGQIPSEEMLRMILPSFKGEQLQTPPSFSAVKIDGKRAYALARKGITPEIAPRTITIDELSMLGFDTVGGFALCKVHCSGGTYVRSLARDIACRLGTIGIARSINRTVCGRFTHDAAVPLSSINRETPLIPINDALCEIPVVQASPVVLRDIAFGRSVVLPECDTDLQQKVLLFQGTAFAALLAKQEDSRYHPEIVAVTPDEVSDANS